MRNNSSPDDVLVARETFAVEYEGESIVIHKGHTRVRADHPIARDNPDSFEAVDLSVLEPIEQATAAPGEKRKQITSDPLDAMKRPQLLAKVKELELEGVKGNASNDELRRAIRAAQPS